MEAMNASLFRPPAWFVGFTAVIFLTLGTAAAQNASIGSESGLDRAMQENVVKKDDMMHPGGKVKVNKAEETAYKTFLASQTGDPATRIQLGEDFATKFPTSHYLPGIYGVLTTSYFAVGNTDKMFDAGSRAVQLDPQNADVLALLSMAIARRVKPTTPDGAEQLHTAETYAKRAIEIIPTMAKPDAADDAAFARAKNDKLALAHSGLGLVDIDNKKYEDARAELTQAVQLASSPDPVDYFLLGNADVQASYYNDAVAA
jgi:tetratricopeptide (TPR) repeat protein